MPVSIAGQCSSTRTQGMAGEEWRLPDTLTASVVDWLSRCKVILQKHSTDISADDEGLRVGDVCVDFVCRHPSQHLVVVVACFGVE